MCITGANRIGKPGAGHLDPGQLISGSVRMVGRSYAKWGHRIDGCSCSVVPLHRSGRVGHSPSLRILFWSRS